MKNIKHCADNLAQIFGEKHGLKNPTSTDNMNYWFDNAVVADINTMAIDLEMQLDTDVFKLFQNSKIATYDKFVANFKIATE